MQNLPGSGIEDKNPSNQNNNAMQIKTAADNTIYIDIKKRFLKILYNIYKMEKGYLKVILGSMFSGKTTELIREYNRHKSCGFKCMFINHKLDDFRFYTKSLSSSQLSIIANNLYGINTV